MRGGWGGKGRYGHKYNIISLLHDFLHEDGIFLPPGGESTRSAIAFVLSSNLTFGSVFYRNGFVYIQLHGLEKWYCNDSKWCS